MSERPRQLDSLFLDALEIESPAERAAFLDRSCGDDRQLREEIDQLLKSHEAAGSFLENPAPELDATMVHDGPGKDLVESMQAGLAPAPAFAAHEAVVIGNAGHSVLRTLAQTIDIPRVALRDADGDGGEPIVRPASAEIPDREADSRYQLQGEIARGGMGAIIKGRDSDLGRDLAIKVLLEEHKASPEVVQRFVEEAQIGGQLQHPGIAPVYELGQFADQRPFFSMKLVKGETLSKLLAARKDPADERGKFLGIFEQICQTMAYAHSRGVIHRDLKPANIMVGAFGEVQVMDWGLAKVLVMGGVADEKEAQREHKDVSVIQTRRSTGSDAPGSVGSVGSETQMGSVMGTPAYMPPEQALGEIDQLDQRADVFGLGAILCEILTGKPPYVGDDGTEVFRLASRGKLDDCFARMDACQADTELIALARDCLELEPSDRPTDASELAERVTGYLESVETKLRETELERATQAARVVEERKRQRVMLALAASVLLTLGLGGGGWMYLQQQQAERAQAATAKIIDDLGEARLHQNLADAVDTQQDDGLEQQVRELDQALSSVKLAFERAREEDVDAKLRTLAEELLAALEQRTTKARSLLEQAVANRAFREELELIRLSMAGGDDKAARTVSSGSDGEQAVASLGAFIDEVTARRRYEEKFRQAGYDLTTANTATVVARIKQSTIRETLIAALDDWSRITHRKELRTRLVAVADAADDSPWRRELRAALAARQLDQLMHLAGDKQVGQQLPALVGWLGAALRSAEELELSVKVLRMAQQQHPADFWLNQELAGSLQAQDQLDESLGYARAAVAIRPRSMGAHNTLGNILAGQGKLDEAIAEYKKAIELDPKAAMSHHNLGLALIGQKKLDEAIAAWRRAIVLVPKYATPHNSLGVALARQGKLDEAIAEFGKAIELDPKAAMSHHNLGLALKDQGKLGEAIAAFRKAIALDPEYSDAHNSLGNALSKQGELGEAIAAWRKAIELDPKSATPHVNVGNVLKDQGKPDEAIAAFRKAIELDPKYAIPHFNLGNQLQDQGKLDEAIAEFRKAIELDPKYAPPHNNLGNALRAQNKTNEALAAYRKAIELDPDYVEPYFNVGLVLRDQGKLDEAIAAWRKATELDPQSSDARASQAAAHVNLGQALGGRGKLHEAIAACRKAIELDHKLAPAHANLGLALARQGKLDEAIAALRRAVELEPRNSRIRQLASKVLFAQALADDQKGTKADAIAAYKEAIELDPNNWQAYNNLGFILGPGRESESIAAWRKAIEVNPNIRSNAPFYLGVLLEQSGKADEAFTAYLTAIGNGVMPGEALEKTQKILKDPKNLDASLRAVKSKPELKLVAFTAFASMGHTEKATPLVAEFSAEVLARRPNDVGAHNQAAWLLSTIPNKAGRYPQAKQAVVWARRACELAPNNGQLWNTLGVALYRAERWSEAIEALNSSVKHGVDGPRNWLFIAMAHHQLKQKTKAAKWYDKSLTWEQSNQPALKGDKELQGFYAEGAKLREAAAATADSPTQSDPQEP